MKRAALALAVLLLILAGAGVAYYLHVKQQSRDVKGSSTVEFVTTQAAVPVRPQEPGIAWPTYGHDPQRLRFANGVTLAPPFKRAWTYRARSLVEFPPAVAYGRLFFANNAGVLFAIGAKNGRKAWKYVSHRCVAASPAVAGHVVYETFLNAPPCNRKPSGKLTGELVAFTVGHGRVLWRKTIYPSESSPVVTAGSVFVGDWSGRIYAFKQRSGKLRWVRKLHGQVKSGVSIAGEQLYVGDYSGHVYSLDIRSGKILWQAKAQRRFGHAGNFYGSPAVAYGRVYIGALKGTTYALDATSGRPVWTFPDGKYSPVVADAARLYLIGNARLYGLDERRQTTQRKLSALTAQRVLRNAGFRHVRVTGTHPLALRLGKGHKRSRRNVCHIALFGAEVNVRRGAVALSQACGRVNPR